MKRSDVIEPVDDEAQADLMTQLAEYGIENQRVLDAMATLYRADFVPTSYLMGFDPYEDAAAEIGEGQTISQPYMVAYMTELINPQTGMKILEIGTGSGYQAALLATLGAEVFTIERVKSLYEHSQKTLAHYHLHQLWGDGAQGWQEKAPFDAIIVACAAENIPSALVEQLCDGGTMIIPVGLQNQNLKVCTKKDGALQCCEDIPVMFVPLVEKI